MPVMCETMKPAPFACGGTHLRCQHEATLFVLGKTAEEKRQKPMPICLDCLKEFLRRNPDYKKLVRPRQDARYWFKINGRGEVFHALMPTGAVGLCGRNIPPTSGSKLRVAGIPVHERICQKCYELLYGDVPLPKR